MILYYQTQADCVAEVRKEEGKWEWKECDIDIQKIWNITAESKKKEKRPVPEEIKCYDLDVSSVDGIWGAEYSFSFYKDCVLLETQRNEKNVKGYVLSKKEEAYIRAVFEDENR